MYCCVQGRAGVPEGQLRRLQRARDGAEGMGGPSGGAHEQWLAPNAHAGKRGVAPAFEGRGGSGEHGCGGGGGGGGGRFLLHAELQERRVQGQEGPAPQGPLTSRQVGWLALGCKAPAGKAHRRACGRLVGGAGTDHARVAEAGGGGGGGGSPPARQAPRGRAPGARGRAAGNGGGVGARRSPGSSPQPSAEGRHTGAAPERADGRGQERGGVGGC